MPARNEIRQRRTYSRDWMPEIGDQWFDDANSQRYFAFKQRLRDHSIVASDQVRTRIAQEPSWVDHFFGGVISTLWANLTVDLVTATSASGGRLNCDSPAGNGSGVAFNGITVVQRADNPIVQIRCDLGQSTNFATQMGLAMNSSVPLTQDYIIFEYDTSVSANWFGKVNATTDGLGSASVNLGVAADTNDRKFMFVVYNSIPAVAFYVENLNTKQYELKGTVTSGIPTSLMQPYICTRPLAPALTSSSQHDFFRLYQDEG